MSTTKILYIILALVGSYVIGCLQPSYLLGKAIKHVDIRDYGSGNSGATNAIRVFGFKFGMVCLLIDALKGLVAVLLVKLFLGPDVVGSEGAAILLQLCCGLCVILGHNYPFYMHFRGGKGVAASIGILLMVDWRLFLIAGIPALLVMVLSRMMSVASLTFETLCFVGLAILCFHMDFYYGIPGRFRKTSTKKPWKNSMNRPAWTCIITTTSKSPKRHQKRPPREVFLFVYSATAGASTSGVSAAGASSKFSLSRTIFRMKKQQVVNETTSAMGNAHQTMLRLPVRDSR